MAAFDSHTRSLTHPPPKFADTYSFTLCQCRGRIKISNKLTSLQLAWISDIERARGDVQAVHGSQDSVIYELTSIRCECLTVTVYLSLFSSKPGLFKHAGLAGWKSFFALRPGTKDTSLHLKRAARATSGVDQEDHTTIPSLGSASRIDCL